MSEKKHAILSPSSASRWLACTPSAQFEQQFPDKAGDAAAEGTLAHDVGELLIRKELGWMLDRDYKLTLKSLTANKFYCAELRGHAEDYAAFVIERYNAAKAKTKDAVLHLEQRLDLTAYVPDGFGTGDAVIIADGTMDIIDLKYGKGVPVFAPKNKQMMLYALGALHQFDLSFDIQTVRMTIYQPRIDNISEWELPAADLKDWGHKVLIPGAAAAHEGTGEYKPGDHCTFCRARTKCKALAAYQLEITRYDFQQINTLTPEDVADILTRADSFTKWLKSIEEDALSQAVNNGVKWPGFKLVEGRSVRKYADPAAVVEKLKASGFDEAVIYKPQEIQGITALTGLIGKKVFAELVDPLCIKPAGKPALVPESDKRPELNSLEKAQAEFANIEIED